MQRIKKEKFNGLIDFVFIQILKDAEDSNGNVLTQKQFSEVFTSVYGKNKKRNK